MRSINSIVEGIVNRYLLNEMVSDVVYHFTHISAALEICKSNRLLLSESITKSSDTMHKKKMFFLSMTRQFNGTQGYSKSKTVRIELDGRRLNERFEGGPVDYWGHRNMSEYEDRLFSDEPYIDDARKYIKKISILLNDRSHENEYIMAYQCLMYAKRNDILVMIFDNVKDFNNPHSTNTINDKIESEYNVVSSKVDRLCFNYVENELKSVIEFCVLLENIRYEDVDEYVAKLLKEYNLSKYIRQIIPYVKKSYTNYHNTLPDINLSYIRRENEYIPICQLLRDVLSRNDVKNTHEANIRWKNGGKEMVYYSDFDTDKRINVLCFSEGFKKIPILNPDTTPFWSIFDKDSVGYYKRNFIERLTYHDSEYGIRSHKSYSDEYFNKYIKHLVKSNKITVTQMLDILNKIDYYDKNNIIYDIFYGNFIEVEITYHSCWKIARNNDEERQLQELFKKK